MFYSNACHECIYELNPYFAIALAFNRLCMCCHLFQLLTFSSYRRIAPAVAFYYTWCGKISSEFRTAKLQDYTHKKFPDFNDCICSLQVNNIRILQLQ